MRPVTFAATGFACTLSLGILLTSNLQAMEPPGTTDDSQRPRIGLALSGGGARGAAHVGVLRALNELRIPIDYIAGTSMGAIVGGLYASGKSADEIEEILMTTDWVDVFHDQTARADKTFRRKLDDELYLIKAKPGINPKTGELKLPIGLIQGQKINLMLERYTGHVATVNDFDELSIPFRAIATDLESGGEVVIGSGNLAQAIRASMSIPIAMAPVFAYDKALVDGGMANNLPISVVREMGADVVIAVDISTPLQNLDDISTVLDVSEQLMGFLSRLRTEVALKTLTERDELIVPELDFIATGDFVVDKIAEAIPAGREAVEQVADSLSRFSLPEGQYDAYRKQHGFVVPPAPVIDFVRFNNQSRLRDELFENYITQEVGQPLDVDQLEADIALIYGFGIFEQVRYQLVEDDGKTGLEVGVWSKSWGPTYLQFGMSLQGNFEGDEFYNFAVSMLFTEMNSLNGEVRLGFQFGSEPAGAVEWYQPLGTLNRWFVEPEIGYLKENVNLFNSAGDIIEERRLTRYGLSLSGGRTLGHWGELRAGWRGGSGTAEVRVGDPTVPDVDFDIGELFARFTVDEFDNFAFPHRGGRFSLEYIDSNTDFGADSDFHQFVLQASKVRTWGRYSVIVGGRYETTPNDNAPIQNLFRAGGFLRLSGFDLNQLSGQHYGQLVIAPFRRIGDFNLLPIYVGASLEYGNVWQSTSDISLSNAFWAGSLWLGAETPLGPIYVAYGQAEEGHNSVYFFLGRAF